MFCLFTDHIREPYRVFLECPRSFDAPINAEYSHLPLLLRSAICMWPYAAELVWIRTPLSTPVRSFKVRIGKRDFLIIAQMQ